MIDADLRLTQNSSPLLFFPLSSYPVLQPYPQTPNLPPSLLLLFLHLPLLRLALALAPTTFANGANEIPDCEGQDEKEQDAGCRDIEEDHEGGEGGVEFGGWGCWGGCGCGG